MTTSDHMAPHISGSDNNGTTVLPVDYALSYAAMGWHVLPCYSIHRGACTCSKGANCPTPGKHPRTANGSKDATTDTTQIAAWWSRWPDANIAVNVGRSGLVVVDVDLRKDGFASVDALPFTLPATLIASTGSGGRHYVFARPEGEDVHGRNNWRPGVDVKASENDYVILPPSSHITGGVYRWQNWGQTIAVAPEDVIESLRRSTAGGSTGQGGFDLSDVIAGLPEGQRDEGIFRAACLLRNRLNDDRGLVTNVVLELASRCTPPFPPEEARVKVDQAFKMPRERLAPELVAWARTQGHDPAATPRLNLRRASEVRARKRPPMLVEDVLPPGGLFQVFGQTGAYKSFVIVDLICSVANNIDWMGHKVNESGLVALVLGEGAWDAGNRIDAWMLAHPDCDDDRVLYSVEEGLDLMDHQQVTSMIEDLTAWQEAHFPEDRWKVIVFDTQADHMPTGDEDKSKDFTVIKKAIQRIAQATGAAVGLVHHTGWDDSRERGSSRQRQALDVVMQVKSQTITNIKQKYGPKFDPIKFTTETVEEAGSIYVRMASPAEEVRLAFENAQTAEESDALRALALMVEQPRISNNRMQKALGIGAGKWVPVRNWLEMRGYVTCTRDDGGVVKGFAPTDKGVEWLHTEMEGGKQK